MLLTPVFPRIGSATLIKRYDKFYLLLVVGKERTTNVMINNISEMETDIIVRNILSGDVRTVARLISDLEDEIPEAYSVLDKIYPHTGRAFVIGVTGSPGSGKSSLIDCLVDHLRNQNKSVGILAVDPSSPFSGGSLLGDRIRMNRRKLDDDVYYRSMASRCFGGGVAKAANNASHVFDAMGKDYIIVETVGVGQGELDIMNLVHAVVVVLVPGMGDDIQTIKAGILEIADIFVINKADRDGVERLHVQLRDMISLRNLDHKSLAPCICITEAIHNKGVNDIINGINVFREHSGLSKSRCKLEKKAEMDLMDAIQRNIMERIMKKLELEVNVNRLIEREIAPSALVDEIFESLLFERQGSQK